MSMDGHNTNSSPQSEAQFVPRLNKSLPMKYAKQFYCLVTLSSEACCLIHDDNISPCICAFVCVFKSRTLRKRRVWEFIKKKDRGRRQVAGVRRKLYFCQGDFARLIQRNCVSVSQTMREKRGETPQSNTWVKEEKPKRKSEELKWKCEKRRRKHKCTQNFNALHMYRHKNLHRYRKPQKLFPIIKVSGHYLHNHQQSLKPVDICNHLSLLWSCVTDHHETVSHQQIPQSIKPPCICSLWAESPKHATAIAGTVGVMSQQVCCFLTADGKHLLWQHWLGCGRYCETREFPDAWFSVRIIQQRWQTSLQYMWVDLNNGISPTTRTFFVVFFE